MMQHLSRRLPARSQVITLLLVCVFPIHAWSLLVYFREVPAYLRRMGIGEMLGILAYVQAFSLLESICVLGLLTAAAFLLPGRLFKDYYVAQGSVLVLCTALWLAPVHFQGQLLVTFAPELPVYLLFLGIWAFSFLSTLFVLSVSIRRRPVFRARLEEFAGRLVVLSSAYIFLGVMGTFTVLFLNFF